MAEEETKVTVEIPISTLNYIKKAKEKLSQHELFTWIKHLSVDEFLAFYFGWTEVSQFCRETFHQVFKEVNNEPLVAKEKPKPKTVLEEQKIQVSPLMKKVVDALAQAKMPLTRKQLQRITNLQNRQVDWILTKLRRKGIVTRAPKSLEWQLTVSPEQVAVKPPTLKKKLLSYINTLKTPFTANQVARRLNISAKTVRLYLYKLRSKGVVEKVGYAQWIMKKKHKYA